MKICRIKKFLSAAAAAAVLTMASLVPSSYSWASEESENEYVNNDKNGIIQVEVWYQPVGKADVCIRTGTAFLINHSTALTSWQLVNIDDDSKDSIAGVYSIDPANRYEFDESCLHYEITMPDDEKIKAVPNEMSEKDDFAVLTLDVSLSERTPLWLGDSDHVTQNEEVFSLGFPTGMDKYKENPDYEAYLIKDVTVAKGTVSDAGFSFSDDNSSGGRLIRHNAAVGAGNAGGPLVDSRGVVVGMNTLIGFDEELSYATAINRVRKTLDDLGIMYNNSEWKPDSVTEERIKESKNMIPMIILIIAGILAAVIVVALLASKLSSKKRKRSRVVPPIPSAPVDPADIQAPVDNYTPASVNASLSSVRPEEPKSEPEHPEPPKTTFANQGEGETAVLKDSGNSFYMNVGGKSVLRPVIIRKRSGLSVRITSSDFVIGKEQSKVDYCIHNNAVSRRHARITVTAGRCFITDLGSSNHTYVNGRLIPPDTPQMLRNGDLIRLADEEFEFRG